MRGGVPVLSRSMANGARAGARPARWPAVAHAPGGVLGLADVDLAGQEGAGGQHHRPAVKRRPVW
jgi:hypothetical protein